MAIESLATLDLPMVVDSIGIFELKGPYCMLNMIDWFLQALSVIPRGLWDDVARRFTMIRWPPFPAATPPLSPPATVVVAPTAVAVTVVVVVIGIFSDRAACLDWSRREDIQARTVKRCLSWTGRRYQAGIVRGRPNWFISLLPEVQGTSSWFISWMLELHEDQAQSLKSSSRAESRDVAKERRRRDL
ncbi:hypothetical protein F511_38202 [Dorcoceras hygrometricum]|uniref:Uncharacterized protein n=1 Tax=Dorcoceras hygrometricum TaxID=472368 RepID=A0A2Z7A2B7_9LAMI|nr:hypothetical protein F511_38202 [Dorcoceras hygrometricum]